MYATEFVPEMRLLGHAWKLPFPDKEGVLSSTKEVGSEGTWYEGKKEALQLLAHEKLGQNSPPLQFKSRAKHSAYACGRVACGRVAVWPCGRAECFAVVGRYKECHDCQTKRLLIARLIADKASADEIQVAHVRSGGM